MTKTQLPTLLWQGKIIIIIVSMIIDHPVDCNIYKLFFRTRRLLAGSNSSGDRKTGAALVANMIASVPKIKQEKLDEDDVVGGAIVLDTTAEFCRNIGEEDEPEEKETVKNIRGYKEEEMVCGIAYTYVRRNALLFFVYSHT